jgi:hypothetical protein
MDSFPPYNQIDYPKPRLNSLLLILIVALFASGAALIILRQIDSYDRDQIYLATQASLPEHKVSAAAVLKNEEIAKCQSLPTSLLDNVDFNTWMDKYSLDARDFCGETMQELKYDLPGETIYKSSQDCQNNFGGYPGQLSQSPDGHRSLCSGSFGEPDSYAIIFSKIASEQGRLRFCGTSCGFDGGVWINNDMFVLFENTIEPPGYIIELFDFKEKKQRKWGLSTSLN